jgi:hypothetical protein
MVLAHADHPEVQGKAYSDRFKQRQKLGFTKKVGKSSDFF